MNKWLIYSVVTHHCYKLFRYFGKFNHELKLVLDIPLDDMEVQINEVIKLQLCYDLEKEDV